MSLCLTPHQLLELEVNTTAFYFICQEYGRYPGFEVYYPGFEVCYDNKISSNSSKTQNNSITLQLQCYYCDSQHARQWTLFQNFFYILSTDGILGHILTGLSFI